LPGISVDPGSLPVELPAYLTFPDGSPLRCMLPSSPRRRPTAEEQGWRRRLPAFLQGLEAVLATLRPPGRRLDRGDEELLCQWCYCLAIFEQLFRLGPGVYRVTPLATLRPGDGVEALLALAGPLAVEDLRDLSWAFWDRHGALTEKPGVMNPTFAGSSDVGGADADLIVDGCLLECKTTLKPSLNREVIYQALGYVLLDYTDLYGITAVGTYFARQSFLRRWPLEELLQILTGSTGQPIAGLRAAFQDAAGSGSSDMPVGRPARMVRTLGLLPPG
jgi:hypothetical protein